MAGDLQTYIHSFRGGLMNIYELLHKDHEKVLGLLDEAEPSENTLSKEKCPPKCVVISLHFCNPSPFRGRESLLLLTVFTSS